MKNQPSSRNFEIEESQDIVDGLARVPFCKVRNGWAFPGGKTIRSEVLARSKARILSNLLSEIKATGKVR